MQFAVADFKAVHVHYTFGTHGTLCVLQVFYSFSFWLMFRQQLKERQEEQSMKEESLDEVKVMSRNSFWNCFHKDYVCCIRDLV